jgi:hypothetical protein
MVNWMMQLSAMDKAGIAIAAFLIFGGLFAVVYPRDVAVGHSVTPGRGGKSFALVEHVTASRARVYGVISVLSGCVLGGIVLYGAKP